METPRVLSCFLLGRCQVVRLIEKRVLSYYNNSINLKRKVVKGLFKNKIVLWTFEVLMVFLILYLGTQVSFLFQPIGVFATTLFFPVLIAGFFYYLFNPVITLLERKGVKRSIGILILFIGILLLIAIGIGFLIPIIFSQLRELVQQFPIFVDKALDKLDLLTQSPYIDWVMSQDYVSMDQLKDYLLGILTEVPQKISSSLSNVLSVVVNIGLLIVTVPVLLFYMFKDGHKFPHAASKFFPSSYRTDAVKIIRDMGNTISAFIQGQMTVALFVGTLSFIGFLLIQLPYALVLSLAVAITNIIPYVGPIIGAIPAAIIGLFISPFQFLLVVLVIVIAQQLEGNVLSPLILGKTLNTHPVTIIILLLVAGNIAGILGMVLAVPLYAVAKVVIVNVIKLIKLHKEQR